MLDNVISVDRINRFKAMPEVYQMVVDDYRLYPDAVSFQSSNRWDVAAATGVWISHGLVQPGATNRTNISICCQKLVLADLNGLIGADGKPV